MSAVDPESIGIERGGVDDVAALRDLWLELSSSANSPLCGGLVQLADA